jgi:hypothetical protein
MENRRFSAFNLVKETFSTVGSLFTPLLIILLPNLIFSLIANSATTPGFIIVGVTLAYIFLVGPWIAGTASFYAHQQLTGSNVSISYSFQRCSQKIPNLILGSILAGLIIFVGYLLLIIPGLYFTGRLALVFYVIAIEDCSAVDGVKRSWQLSKGHWWFIFRTSLLLGLIYLGLILLLVVPLAILAVAFGDLVGALVGYSLSPVGIVALVLVYNRLQGETRVKLKKS